LVVEQKSDWEAGNFEFASVWPLIDTREGQRLAVASAGRRIDPMNRAAANAVPLPPRIYGR